MSNPISPGANAVSEQPDRLRLGWFSTWNSRCGIAEYSKLLLAELDHQRFNCTVIAPINELRITADEAGIVRCWNTRGGAIAPLLSLLEERRFDVFVMQFKLQAHFSWLSLQQLEAVIACCHALGTKVLIFLHSTDGADYWENPVSLPRIKYSLTSVHRVLVHSTKDLERLRAFGIDCASVIPHGFPENPNVDRLTARLACGLPEKAFIVGSYGFLLPHKGIDKLIEALPLLHTAGIPAKLLLINALYPLSVSQEYLSKCEHRIIELGVQEHVTLESRFLANEVSLQYLAACDCIIFPYQEAEDSTSAAVRFGLAAHRPVLCSPQPIFSDVANITYFLPGWNSHHISEGVQAFLQDHQGRERLAARQEEWLDRHSWRNIGLRFRGILQETNSTDLEPIRSRWVGKFIANKVAHEEHVENLKEQIEMLNKRVAEMTASEAVLNRCVADLEVDAKKWEQVADTRRAELNAVYASTSWRVTRPLRSCACVLKQLAQHARGFRSYLLSMLRSSAGRADPTKALQMELSAHQRSIFLDLKHADARQR
jgi:glycosyltransferase involved in cell wall biosynthesis